MDLYSELSGFRNGLKSYKELLNKLYYGAFTSSGGSLPFNSPYDSDSDKRTQLMNEIGEKREYLVRSSGRLTPRITEITEEDTRVIFELGKSRSVNIWEMGLREEFDYRTAETLNACIDVTNKAIGRLESDIASGMRNEQGELTQEGQIVKAKSEWRRALNETGAVESRAKQPITGIRSEYPKAFIAHGGKTNALNKLQKFLIALDIQPLIIEEEPKEGRSVNEQVDYYSAQADCAVVLGTADDTELKDGKLYPRRNVYIEIGRFQEKFPNKIIYLLEEGASFPSNISEKLYTRFVQESMDEAFITVARELKAFGILKAGKTKE